MHRKHGAYSVSLPEVKDASRTLEDLSSSVHVLDFVGSTCLLHQDVDWHQADAQVLEGYALVRCRLACMQALVA